MPQAAAGLDAVEGAVAFVAGDGQPSGLLDALAGGGKESHGPLCVRLSGGERAPLAFVDCSRLLAASAAAPDPALELAVAASSVILFAGCDVAALAAAAGRRPGRAAAGPHLLQVVSDLEPKPPQDWPLGRAAAVRVSSSSDADEQELRAVRAALEQLVDADGGGADRLRLVARALAADVPVDRAALDVAADAFSSCVTLSMPARCWLAPDDAATGWYYNRVTEETAWELPDIGEEENEDDFELDAALDAARDVARAALRSHAVEGLEALAAELEPLLAAAARRFRANAAAAAQERAAEALDEAYAGNNCALRLKLEENNLPAEPSAVVAEVLLDARAVAGRLGGEAAVGPLLARAEARLLQLLEAREEERRREAVLLRAQLAERGEPPELAALRGEVVALRQRVSASGEDTVAALRSELQSANDERDLLLATVEQRRRETRTIDGLVEDIRRLGEARDAAAGELAAARGRVGALEEELAAVTATATKQVAALQAANRALLGSLYPLSSVLVMALVSGVVGVVVSWRSCFE